MGETLVLLMLVGWLAYTALMTIRSGGEARREEAMNPTHVEHVSAGPAPAQAFAQASGDELER